MLITHVQPQQSYQTLNNWSGFISLSEPARWKSDNTVPSELSGSA